MLSHNSCVIKVEFSVRVEEAKKVAEWVLDLPLSKQSICLNIGSSTGKFRQIDQPHIDSFLIQPLLASGIRIIHCDMKNEIGVDEVGDVFDEEYRKKLKSYNANLLLCCNLLEHLTDPIDFARSCGELIDKGGYCIITVPFSFPYHPDPIDTLFRPKPEEIADMLPGFSVVRSEVLEAGSYYRDLIYSGRPFRNLAYNLLRAFAPFYRTNNWLFFVHRLFWLFRKYKQSVVLLKKD